MKNAQISFDDEFLAAIDHIAEQTNKTRSAIVREAVKYWLKVKQISEFEEQWIQALKTQTGESDELDTWNSIEHWSEG